MKRIYFLVGLLFVCVILFAIIYPQNNNTKKISYVPEETTQDSQQISSSPVDPKTLGGSQTVDTGIKGQKKFTSNRLGISFLFNASEKNKEATINETSSSIQILVANQLLHTIQTYPKNPNSSFKVSLNDTILLGKEPSKCIIQTGLVSSTDLRFPLNYETGQVDYPDIKVLATSGNVLKNISDREDYCGKTYSRSAKGQSFLYNPKTTNKFIHVQIGTATPLTESPTSTNPFSHSIEIF